MPGVAMMDALMESVIENRTQGRANGEPPCAVIVGGRTGIGRALAGAWHRAGWAVRTASRSAADTIGWSHARVDIRDSHAVADFLSAQPFDVLVHTAGVQGDPASMGPTWATDPVAFAEVVAVDFLGAYHVLHAAIRSLRAHRRGGTVVLFSGGGAAGPRPGLSAYAAAKAGVVRMVENVQAELDAEGGAPGARVRVYAAAPGAVHTAMTDQLVAARQRVPAEAAAAAEVIAGRQGTTPAAAVALCDALVADVDGRLAGRLVHALEDYGSDRVAATGGHLRRTALDGTVG